MLGSRLDPSDTRSDYGSANEACVTAVGRVIHGKHANAMPTRVLQPCLHRFAGYLQRCLVKNLESLKVHYDSTVRDDCDQSIVQVRRPSKAWLAGWLAGCG
jgi:hypothetical protein